MIYVLMYLAAIVAANISVMLWGPSVSVINAFLFVGFNLTARDKLHDAWQGINLRRNMFMMIAAGACVSALFGAGRIAVASFVAFALSEAVDAIVYHRMGSRSKLMQVNGSNTISAAVDSVIFPTLAFGLPLLWPVMLGQFLAKVFGGAVWFFALRKFQRKTPAASSSPNIA